MSTPEREPVWRVTFVHEGLLGTEVFFCESRAQADAMVAECAIHCEVDGGDCAPPVIEQGWFEGFNFVPQE